MRYRSYVLSVLFCLGLMTRVSAEEFTVSPLTAEQQAVIETIDQGDVLATVSFLASDEMGGRNTPSPELDIAAAYVAARFKGAGLDGLGPDGSYYQPKELKQFVGPKGTASVSAGGERLKTLGVLFSSAGSEVVDGCDHRRKKAGRVRGKDRAGQRSRFASADAEQSGVCVRGLVASAERLCRQ